MSSRRHAAAVILAVGAASACSSAEPAPTSESARRPARIVDVAEDHAPLTQPVSADVDRFVRRYCEKLGAACWADGLAGIGRPLTDATRCVSTLLELAQTAGTTFDGTMAQACEREAFWRSSLTCGGVLKKARSRGPGAVCAEDSECANEGTFVGLCATTTDGRRCVVVKRGRADDACLSTSGEPLVAEARYAGAICLREDQLFCEGGRCTPRRAPGEACAGVRPAECRDHSSCIGGACVDERESGACGADVCAQAPGEACGVVEWYGGVPRTSCAGECIVGRCTAFGTDAREAACLGFTTAHSFEY